MSPARVDEVDELPEYQYPPGPGHELDYADLEVLDISKIDHPEAKFALAKQVLSFINKNGFFYVKGHGLSDAQIRRQYAIGSAVFDLPLDEKLPYICDTASGDFRGYKPRSTGKLAARDTDERYNIAKFTPEHAHLAHPEIVRRHLSEIEAFSRHIHDKILLPLLRIFAVALELPDEEYFVDRHNYDAKGLEYLRYMKYHPRSREADAEVSNIWARGHTDYNTLTFLFYQPVAGLQVLTPETSTAPSQWKYVHSPRDAIIVNVADALEFASGAYLRSTLHRVVRPPEDQASKARMSLIYFARPQADMKPKPVVSPLLKRLGLQREGEGRDVDAVTAEEWARRRIAKDHKFRTGAVDSCEGEIVAGMKQVSYD